MKILLHSNSPWTTSGYGGQTHLLCHRLRDAGHDVAISAFYGLEGTILDWNGFTIYPTDHTRLGKYMLKRWVKDFAGDTPTDDVLVITLMDVWTWIDIRMGPPADFDGLRLAAWVPVDHEPIPPRVCEALERYNAKPIAMSRFGETQLRAAGFDPLYVPHAIDTNVYKPSPEDAGELKKAMGLDPDRFVIGMVANNRGVAPPRKSFSQTFQAFHQFQKQHPDAFLYLHCDVLGFPDGINLSDLADLAGVPRDSYGAVDQDKYMAGTITPEQMARVYSIMDVLANPSHGEGFGIPIIEAQACGVPVIVTDWTAMPELVGAGWTVDGDRLWDPAQASFYKCPSVYEIVDAFEKAYQARGDTALRRQAVEFASAYDADTVFSGHWKPALAALADRHTSGRAATGEQKWCSTGLSNPDGSISFPSSEGHELVVAVDGTQTILPKGSFARTDLEFVEPDGIEWIVLRECERDYGLDRLELHPDDIAIDIGAHVGVVSMYLAARFGCRVIAYEPDPKNYRRLVRNLAANNLDGLVDARRLAVTSDGRNVVVSGNRETNSGGLNIYGEGPGESSASVTLADIIDETGPAALLKIDCEGAEFEILADLDPLSLVGMVRGEFHASHGDPAALLSRVRAVVPDTHVTLLGSPNGNRAQRRARDKTKAVA